MPDLRSFTLSGLSGWISRQDTKFEPTIGVQVSLRRDHLSLLWNSSAQIAMALALRISDQPFW
jgi:hypothetical protein